MAPAKVAPKRGKAVVSGKKAERKEKGKKTAPKVVKSTKAEDSDNNDGDEGVSITLAAPEASATIDEVKKNGDEKANALVENTSTSSTALTKPSPITAAQANKATRALLKFLSTPQATESPSTAKPNLLSDDTDSASHILLILTAKQFLTKTRSLKPIRLPLAHPIHNPAIVSALLIVKDPQRYYKDLLLGPTTSGIVQKVIGLQKLRKKFKTFETLRQLRDAYDVILADDRIVPNLRQVLGSTFLRSTTKVPIPVDVAGQARTTPEATAKALEKEIKKAVLGSTYAHLRPSTSVAIRVGTAAMTPEQVTENIISVVDAAVSGVGNAGQGKILKKGGWKLVRSVYVRSESSAALPLYLAASLVGDEKSVVTLEEREAEKKQIEERKAEKDKRRKERKEKRSRTLAEKKAEKEKEAEKEAAGKKRKADADGLEAEETKKDLPVSAADASAPSPPAKKQKVKKAKKETKPADDTSEEAPPAPKATKTKKAKKETPQLPPQPPADYEEEEDGGSADAGVSLEEASPASASKAKKGKAKPKAAVEVEVREKRTRSKKDIDPEEKDVVKAKANGEKKGKAKGQGSGKKSGKA